MEEEARKARARSAPADRVIVLGLLAGAWCALFTVEALEAGLYRQDAAGLTGPDWDVRAPGPDLASPLGPSISPEPYPRALRQARGIGRRRSMDLTRYFEAHGNDASPEGLYGIGKTTAAAASHVTKALSHAGPGDPR